MRDLNSAPLRQLPEEKIGPYASWAITTVGDLTEYKYYLPRILEVAVLDGVSHTGTSPDGIVFRLNYGDFWKWPKHEQEALLNFFKSAFTFTCLEAEANSHPSEWVVALAELDSVGPVIEALTPLTLVSIVNRALAVAELIVHFERDTRKKDTSSYTLQTRQWLLEGNAAEEMLLEGARAADEVDEWQITNAFDELQLLKAKRIPS